MTVTCLQLSSQVTLETERGNKLHFKEGDILMIMFGDEDNQADYLVCAAGGGLPFVWVAKNHSHKIIPMEFKTWQELAALRS